MTKIRLGDKEIYYQVFYKKIKNMYLRIKDDKLVITANKTHKNSIEDFIKKNETKILRVLDNQENRVPLYNKEVMLIFGFKYNIIYTIDNKKNRFNITESAIYIDFKSDDFDNQYVEKIYKKLLHNKMEKLIEEDVMLKQYFDLTNISLKTQLMKSRFGSCIAKKKIIKLNSILARFNEDYTKTILIHEIIHLKVHNHQKEFYYYIDKLIPNYIEIIRSLNALTRKYVI